MLGGSRSKLDKIHKCLESLVDSPDHLPEWNLTLTVARALFNYGAFEC